MARGTGTTTQQLKAAPQGAHFIWCNENPSYARDLARDLGRDDIRIHQLGVLDTPHLFGIEPDLIVLDHAAELTDIRRAIWGQLVRRATVITRRKSDAT